MMTEAKASQPFARILVGLPIDDDRALAVLERSIPIARALGADMRLVTVLPPFPPNAAMTPMGSIAMGSIATAEGGVAAATGSLRAFCKRRTTVLDEALSAHDAKGYVEQVQRRGAPQAEILAEAEEWKADLIILAARDRNWLERIIDPSVSGAVARKAHRAVLILPASALPVRQYPVRQYPVRQYRRAI